MCAGSTGTNNRHCWHLNRHHPAQRHKTAPQGINMSPKHSLGQTDRPSTTLMRLQQSTETRVRKNGSLTCLLGTNSPVSTIFYGSNALQSDQEGSAQQWRQELRQDLAVLQVAKSATLTSSRSALDLARMLGPSRSRPDILRLNEVNRKRARLEQENDNDDYPPVIMNKMAKPSLSDICQTVSRHFNKNDNHTQTPLL